MSLEAKVAQHYSSGDLLRRIQDGLKAMGRDPHHPGREDIAGVDEFHIRGRDATAVLAGALVLHRGERLLDIGCGIGGPARYFAVDHGCRVTGVDLTPEFIEVARSLTRTVAPDATVDFAVASALDLPFADGSFDVATLIHVGMNIQDKGRLAAETARVLAKGGRFGIYDVMRIGDGELSFPVPWAGHGETSFLEEPSAYRTALAEAGFEILSERDLREPALAFYAEMKTRTAEQGTPPLGLHVIIGDEAPIRLGNTIEAIERGVIAPIEMIALRR